MKITGTRSNVKFDLEDGYAIKAKGELLTGKSFVVYKNSMTKWEPPHSEEPVTKEQIDSIIETVKSMEQPETAHIFFE